MNFDLTQPCKHCPFRTDIAPYLRPGRVDELRRDLVDRQATFSCHKTVDCDSQSNEDGSDDYDYTPSADEQHCAGALILLEKIGKPNQMMRWMERLGAYDRTKLKMTAPVFDSFAAMRRAMQRATAKTK